MVIYFLLISLYSMGQESKQKEFQIVIKDKKYFKCYLNPFGRFNNELADIYWSVGIYDSINLLSKYKAEFIFDTIYGLKKQLHINIRNDDSCYGNLIVFNILSTLYSKSRMKVIYSTEINHIYFSCSRYLGEYLLDIDSQNKKINLLYKADTNSAEVSVLEFIHR